MCILRVTDARILNINKNFIRTGLLNGNLFEYNGCNDNSIRCAMPAARQGESNRDNCHFQAASCALVEAHIATREGENAITIPHLPHFDPLPEPGLSARDRVPAKALA